MPWNNKGIMSLRKEFIMKVQAQGYKVSHLCREYRAIV